MQSDALALFELANQHMERCELEAAEQSYRAALKLAPGLASAHMNLGTLLLRQRRFSEAEACYGNALALESGKGANWSNLGSLYLRYQREDDAEVCLRRAIALEPDNRVARFNLSYLQLRHGHFSEGWALFEARDWYARFEAQFRFPRWQGEALEGKSLLLCMEAGHGDVIQFVRYSASLKARGVRHLTLLCHAALVRLLHGLPSLDAVIGYQGGPLPDITHDYWMPLMSAPYYLKADGATDFSFGLTPPYLQADPALCRQWSEAVPDKGFRVGLVWKGNPEFEFDSTRSLPDIHALKTLWQVQGVEFVSLQKGAGEAEALEFANMHPLTCLGQRMQDFADAAAIISQLDLVISVDSAIAHLAAALGKPCWILLPDFMCDWRWGAHRTDSPWYPGVVRLFRQGRDARWEPVVEAVKNALQEVTKNQRTS